MERFFFLNHESNKKFIEHILCAKYFLQCSSFNPHEILKLFSLFREFRQLLKLPRSSGPALELKSVTLIQRDTCFSLGNLEMVNI